MRTGNISSLSERDWAAIRERKAFEQDEDAKQILAEDQAEYQKYVQIVEEDQQRVAPAFRIEPIKFEHWRSHIDPTIADPLVRGASATNAALLLKVRQDEATEAEKEREEARRAIAAGERDKSWKMPESAKQLRMSVDNARAYVREQGRRFADNTPEYVCSDANFKAIKTYLIAQGVAIPNEDCLKAGWLRLRELGLIEERPAPEPEPEPTPVQEPLSVTPVDSELLDGFCPETGQPRKFTQREIWNMDSRTYRKAFRMWGNNQPKFTRGYYS